jgi:hypothetical protein
MTTNENSMNKKATEKPVPRLASDWPPQTPEN